MARVATMVLDPGPNHSKQLVYHPSPDSPGTFEEVVLHVQGYVVSTNLPPIQHNTRQVTGILVLSFNNTYRTRLGAKPLTSTQSIAISGLGSEQFEMFLKGLTCIHDVFKEHLGGASLNALSTRLDHGFLTLFFSNRYFTHSRDVKDNTVIPVPSDIDPVGILASVSGGIFTKENNVKYFERMVNDKKM